MSESRRTRPTLEERVAAGELDGYRPGVPTHGGVDIDREVCREATCPDCGQVGLAARFFKQHPMPAWKSLSYRAFWSCPQCGASEEF